MPLTTSPVVLYEARVGQWMKEAVPSFNASPLVLLPKHRPHPHAEVPAIYYLGYKALISILTVLRSAPEITYQAIYYHHRVNEFITSSSSWQLAKKKD